MSWSTNHPPLAKPRPQGKRPAKNQDPGVPGQRAHGGGCCAQNQETTAAAASGLSLLWSNQSKMACVLLSEGSTTKTKEADNFAFLLTDVAIPDGISRVDVVGYLADAGIYTTEDGMVHGMDGSDSRNERKILKAVTHLGDSSHKHNPVALSQLAEARPSSRTISCELDAIGAYSFNEGGQLMAHVSIMPFGGAPSLEVAYVSGISLISNMHTDERMEAFTRFLLYPTITAIVHGLAAPEKLCFEKQSVLAADTSLPEAQRGLHTPQRQGNTQPHEAAGNGGAGCCAW